MSNQPNNPILERYQKYHECFSSGAGKWVLEDMMGELIHIAASNNAHVQGNNPLGLGYNAGALGLITKIREFAMGDPPKFQHPDDEEI